MLSSFVQVGLGSIYMMSYFNLAGRILLTGTFSAPVRYFIIFLDICVRSKEGNYLLQERTSKYRATVIFLGAAAFCGVFSGWNANRDRKM